MGPYKILLRRSAAKELQKIHGKDQNRIIARIKSLASNPRPPGSKKLSGEEKFRVRQGDYRILYEISEEAITVYVVRIAQRGEAYQK